MRTTAAALIIAAAVILLILLGFQPVSKKGPGNPDGRKQETIPIKGGSKPSEFDENATGARNPFAEGTSASFSFPKPDLGIPSFVGQIFRPNGNPMPGLAVEAFGNRGFIASFSSSGKPKEFQLQWRTQTNSNGDFAFPESPGEDFRFLVRIYAEGYLPIEFLNLPSSPTRTHDLEIISLTSGREVRGVVFNQNNQPLIGVKIILQEDTESQQFRHRQLPLLTGLSHLQTETDSQGKFKLGGIPNGRIRIQAEAPGYSPAFSGPLSKVTQDSDQDVRLTLFPAARLHGVVVGPQGESVPGAELRIEIPSYPLAEFQTAPDGSFQIDLPKRWSTLELQCRARGFLPSQIKLDPDEIGSKLEIRLDRLGLISGQVLDSTSKPVAGAILRLIPYSRLNPNQLHHLSAETLAEARSDGQGFFSLSPNLSKDWKDRFLLLATAPGMAVAKSRGLWISAREQNSLKDISIIMRSGSSISGQVVTPTGQPAEGARVHLIPGEPEAKNPLAGAVFASSDGSFQFSDLSAGRYRLTASAKGFSPAESEAFALEEAREHQALLRLLPLSGIRGKVSGEWKGRGSLRAALRLQGAGQDALESTISADGTFSFLGLAPGTYDVWLRDVQPRFSDLYFDLGSSEGMPRTEILVKPGSIQGVELSLGQNSRGEVTGTVLRNGRPASDMPVYLVPRRSDGSPISTSWKEIGKRMRMGASDKRGEFRLVEISPGDYWLIVDRSHSWPSGVFQKTGSGGRRLAPAGLTRKAVTVSAGQTLDVDVAVSLGSVAGQILHEGNRFMAGTGYLSPQQGLEGVAERPFRLWQDGSFLLNDVPAGHWICRIDGAGFQVQANFVEFEVLEGETTSLEFLAEARN
ncbi:MAG: carboxypeptidase regulatory-like domain-containing protein [Planctomycetota bacterium]|nr:MAG: carboxypeptidase regulatory-like domain-containing protein [Planctomycetota bacterium]